MREIKFRAWDTNNNTMFRVRSLGDNRLDGCLNFYVKGKEFPLMQYTGLKDKNGKEIYEGDVILFDINKKTQRKFVVVWNVENARFLISNDGKLWAFDKQEYMLIIGNIYENDKVEVA